MFWSCGHTLPFSGPCDASHKLPTFSDPVPNGPGPDASLMYMGSLSFWVFYWFYSQLVSSVDSPSLLQRRTTSDMGVTRTNGLLFKHGALLHSYSSWAAQGLWSRASVCLLSEAPAFSTCLSLQCASIRRKHRNQPRWKEEFLSYETWLTNKCAVEKT